MALCKLLGICFVLVCTLQLGVVFSQPYASPECEGSPKVLNASELAGLNLTQNPSLLDVAALIEESHTVCITAPEQGLVAQSGVNVLLDCLP